jgi:hypothetical protein
LVRREILALLVNFRLRNLNLRRRLPGHTPDLGKNLVEPLFRVHNLGPHIVSIPDASFQIDV